MVHAQQQFPSKVIRLMVGAPPGGSVDFGARIIAQPLAEALGATVLVENKPGAGGTINSAYVANAQPDGHTLLVTTATAVIVVPQAMPKPPLNALTDLQAINTVGVSPVAIAVNPKLGVKTLKDFIALSRTRQVSIASPGTGSLMHLIIESIVQATGANFLHVPYSGTGPGIVDTIAGHVDAVISDLAPFPPFLQDGKMTMIAVTTDKRLEGYPDVPTVSEVVPGFVVLNWQGIFVASKTPKAVVDKINDALLKVAARDDVRAAFRKGAINVAPMASPEAFQKNVTTDYHRWGKLLKEKGIVFN